jgi:hypothetical protein
MNITKRKVTTIFIDAVYITADEWDNRTNGTKVWREHMTKLLNAKVVELVPKCDAMKFREEMIRYAHNLRFGQVETIDTLTLDIYG